METTQDMDKLFQGLYDNYKDILKRMVMKYCDGNDALAEDAVQQAFYNLYVKLDKYGMDYIDEYRAYLYMSARNILFNYHRDNAKLMFGDKDEVLGAMDKDVLSTEDEYMQAIRRVEEETLLDKLKVFNSTWHYVLIEVYVKKRTQKDVAQELGISESNMYAMLRRVRKWAHKNLASLSV